MKVLGITKTSAAGELPAYFKGWFTERFGDHFAQISIDTTLKLKNAVKDVARTANRRCPKCDKVFRWEKRCEPCGSNTVGFVPERIEKQTKRFVLPPMGVTDFNFTMGYEGEDGSIVLGTSEVGHDKTDKALVEYISENKEDWEIVKKALGLARQKSRHACAFVIMNEPVEKRIPLTTISGVRVTSFTAGPVEAVGGLKMDFLVVKSLKDIQDAIHLIQAGHTNTTPTNFVPLEPGHIEVKEGPDGEEEFGVTQIYKALLPEMRLDGRRVPGHRIVPTGDGGYADIWDLPEDQAVFKDVSEARTETVFQFNTPSAMQWLSHFNYQRPDGTKAINSVGTMAAFTALDRPGPLDIKVLSPDWDGPIDHPDGRHNMLVEFARRARGARPSLEVLKVLDDLVPETYGIMTYQEQLQRVYQNLTGCTGAEAEEFRTNVSKKQKDKVDAARPAWMERAGEKIGTENAEQLWKFMVTWAKYGFNKSHAVCYAVVAYACAWLKHYYPLEWWCAVLRNATKKKINEKHWKYCGRIVALPDIQLSEMNWAIQGDKVRAPLNLLQGVGEKAHQQLCRGAPYSSLEDFVEKLFAFREDHREEKDVRKAEGPAEKVMALGRSSVNRGHIYNLIVAGAMDSLFEPGTMVDEALQAYDETVFRLASRRAEASTSKRDKDAWKRTAKPKKKVYPTLDPISRYQCKKEVLPAFGADLRVTINSIGELPPFLKVVDNGKRMRFQGTRWDRERRREVPTDDAVVGWERLEALNTTTTMPPGGFRCAVIAYIQQIGKDGKRYFQYENKTKEACKLTLEVGGCKNEFVHWPAFDGGLPETVRSLQEGAVVAALLVRNQTDKPFSIKELRVIRPALEKEEKKEETTDAQAV